VHVGVKKSGVYVVVRQLLRSRYTQIHVYIFTCVHEPAGKTQYVEVREEMKYTEITRISG